MRGTLLFDLDGTLVDSVPDLVAALNRLAAPRGMAPFAAAEAAMMVGDGARVLVDRAFAARGRTATAADLAGFLAEYEAHLAEHTSPYPGIPALLDRLRGAGWTLAVCTNKPEAAARGLIDQLGWGATFAAIGGGDSFPVRKPDPGHLLATLRAAGDARPALMIGDHRNDMAAAHGAGLPAVFVAWGYGTPAMSEGAAAIAADATALEAVIAGLA